MMKPQKQVFWHSSWLIRISILVHILLLGFVILYPEYWLYALLVFILNHLVITITGLLPRSHWLGSNWTRLPEWSANRNEIALTIDDGPEPEVTPQVLEILDRYQVKATFFCIGRRASLYPELTKEIVQRGHEVGNHSQRHHHNFSLSGTQAITREVASAQQTLTNITGVVPKFFRAPAGLRNLFLAPVLARLNLQLSHWSIRAYDTKVKNPEKVTAKLLSGIKPGAILLLHDGNAARTKSDVPMILAVLPTLIEAAKQQNLRFVTLTQAAEQLPAYA
jgi:peptidoglycan/xylan/chitin deacetylase (PgdA/CDA1 family)